MYFRPQTTTFLLGEEEGGLGVEVTEEVELRLELDCLDRAGVGDTEE